MPWDRPTLKQLNERIARDFSAHLLDGKSLLTRSVLGVLAKVWAGCCHLLYGFLSWVFLQVFIFSCEGFFLGLWGRVLGIPIKDAASAEGLALFSGNPGAEIETGTIMQSAAGVQYVATATARATAAGRITVPARAVQEGSAGNLAAGTALTLVSPLPGIVSKGAAGPDGFWGGVDMEQEEAYRSRLLDRLRRPPRGGAKHDYEAWAREVPGVTRAWCYPLGLGIGTVSLTFVCDDMPDIIPSPIMVARVQAHIDALRPASVKDFEAFAPDALSLVVDVRITPDTDAVRDAVRRELRDLMRRVAAPDTVIRLTHIAEAVSIAAGVDDHRLLAPDGDITVPQGYFPILSDVRFEELPLAPAVIDCGTAEDLTADVTYASGGAQEFSALILDAGPAGYEGNMP